MATTVSTIVQQEHVHTLSSNLSEYPHEQEKQPVQVNIQLFQKALLLQAVREAYTLVTDHEVPALAHPDEILIKVAAVGLNPVDWKAPAFNFGIPGLPWVFGRDLAGIVVKTSSSHSPSSCIQVGDLVLVPSTDYRDIRKAAFQEYAVASQHNAAKIPQNISIHQGACVGVAYVAAALALGVCFGLDFSAATAAAGPNLVHILGGIDKSTVPEDIAGECFQVGEAQHVRQGEWIAIWGASTTTGYIMTQLAKQCRLKVICVADVSRHGRTLHEAGADLLVDRFDEKRAIEIIRGVTGGRLRYALDMVGRETATILQEALCTNPDSPQAHLLGLTGMPKERHPRIRYHSVPIKLFHICEPVAEGLMRWLECLLETGALTPPELIVRNDGLAGVNDALNMLRDGSASNRRIVIDLDGSGDSRT
ncbi:zinc-binding alcohol dehydrogenase family protein [Aspergillus mulundensis]|uniref:Oxidoreductase, zinc-binding dehydrogenase family n=1 Tax=Aspergillus mulundensis TaxID=1810919 RepID=A0A3D8T7U7_9EURO|nr:Oxidoreductase, zinc-binding dehydrogenase family [Aspergillus mulundensis]RDW94068.1 Oxidoreductase, zinc-binding dehydrogenase family [Aspergillus mulundensis]